MMQTNRWLLLAGLGWLLMALAALSLPAAPVAAQGGGQPGFTPTPRPLYALPDPNIVRPSTGRAIALAGNQRYAVTANTFSGTASVVDIAGQVVTAEIPVGESPRALVVAPDGTWLAVTARGSGTVSFIDLTTFEQTGSVRVGLWPWGIATDGVTLYVALQGDSAIAEVDVATRRVLRTFATPAMPTGLTLWGNFLYVTHLNSGALSLLYIPTGQVIATVPGTPDSGLAPSLWLDPFEGVVYVPATRTNASNPALTFDTTVFPVINVFTLRNLTTARASRLALDVADRPLNMPFDISLDRARRWLWVVNAGSDDVSVIDLNTGFAIANLPVGANPRGIVRYSDGSFAFIYNALDGTISIIETAFMQVVDTIAATELEMPIDLLIGAQLFHSSRDDRLSEDRRLSCATCHFDGLSDGRVWTDFPGGPSNTPALLGVAATGPWGWSGAYDELADFNALFLSVQHGDGLLEDGATHDPSGLPNAGRSPDLDALVTYLNTINGPGRNALEIGPQPILDGEAVWMELGCAECHIPPLYMDGLAHALTDDGTGAEIDTPSLRWLWASAPYLHDGRAPTLIDVFAADEGPHHLLGVVPYDDLERLLVYLQSLPLEE